MSGRSATCASYDHSSTPSDSAAASTNVLPPLKRPISATGPRSRLRASRNSSAASSNCSDATPWFSWFEENRNARSSKPSTLCGQRSTLRKRIDAGSRSTEAWIRFLPTLVRPSRRTTSFTPGTGETLLERAHVGPCVPQPRRPPSAEHGRVQDDADRGGGERTDDEPR